VSKTACAWQCAQEESVLPRQLDVLQRLAAQTDDSYRVLRLAIPCLGRILCGAKGCSKYELRKRIDEEIARFKLILASLIQKIQAY
jgi:hypothetical protein